MSVPAGESARFWGASSPREHLLEVYKSESAFIDGLVEFASQGLAAGEAFVMLATAGHRDAVTTTLQARGHDLQASPDTFIALDAAETLARFMVDGKPDEQRFEVVIGSLLERASAGGRPVRAFGEMVTLLWREGHSGATLQVEQLWNSVLRRHPLSLFCACPREESTREITDDFAHVCAAHSQVAFT